MTKVATNMTKVVTTATRQARPIVVGSITEITAVATTKPIAMEIKQKIVGSWIFAATPLASDNPVGTATMNSISIALPNAG
jgi:hypothetical protein